jgi:hypothetical protein
VGKPLGRPRDGENNINMDIKELDFEDGTGSGSCPVVDFS